MSAPPEPDPAAAWGWNEQEVAALHALGIQGFRKVQFVLNKLHLATDADDFYDAVRSGLGVTVACKLEAFYRDHRPGGSEATARSAQEGMEGPGPERPGLQPFTEADWQAYAGCESEDPLGAHLGWGAVILDGARVQAFEVGAEGEVTVWQGAFLRPAVARLVAEALVAAKDPALLPRMLDPL